MFIYRVKKGNREKSVTELLPYQVKLIFENRFNYPYKFVISNAI